MRLELNTGSRMFTGADIHDFQKDISSLISSSEEMVSRLKKINSLTYSLNGGVGVLENAIEQINYRIEEENEKIDTLKEIQTKASSFADLVISVDKEVGKTVAKNKEEFYKVNPWSRPPQQEEDNRSVREKVTDYIIEKTGEIKEELDRFVENAKDTLKKIVTDIGDFIQEHKREIIEIYIGTALIALTIGTMGGAAPVVIAIVGAGTAIGAGAGAYDYYNGNEDGAKSPADAIFKGAAKGYMTSSIMAFCGVVTEGASAGATMAVNVVGSVMGEEVHALADDGKMSKEEAMDIARAVPLAVVGEIINFNNADKWLKASEKEIVKAGKSSMEKGTKEILKNTKSRIKDGLKGVPNIVGEAQVQLKSMKTDVIKQMAKETLKTNRKYIGLKFRDEIINGIMGEAESRLLTTIEPIIMPMRF